QKPLSLVSLRRVHLIESLFLRTIVTPEFQPASCNLKGLPRPKLIHTLDNGLGTRHIEQRQKVRDRLWTDRPIRQAFQQRRQSRRKEHTMSHTRFPRLDRVVQGLDPQAIADQQYEVSLSVPDGI